MPSFRATLKILGLRPGSPPESVMDSAAECVASITTVEDKRIDIQAGTPCITLRYTAFDADHAIGIAADMRHAVEKNAKTAPAGVTRRVKNRWVPVQQPHPTEWA